MRRDKGLPLLVNSRMSLALALALAQFVGHSKHIDMGVKTSTSSRRFELQMDSTPFFFEFNSWVALLETILE